MLHANVRDGHFYHIHSLGDARYPFVAANGSEPLRDGFVETRGGNLHGMRNALHIPDRDSARPRWHDGKVSYSPFVRHIAVSSAFLTTLRTVADGLTLGNEVIARTAAI